MKSPKLATLLAALALSPAFAAETDPVGFVSVTVPANSDAVLAVPLNRAAEFKGVIQSISGNDITVAGTPAWTANAFAPGVTAGKTYAVQIAAGAKEGMMGRITANTNNTVTVTLDSGDDLTGIGTVAVPVDPDGIGPLNAQADQVDIMPYWTPSAMLGNSLPAGTLLIAFGGAGAGINLGATELYGATGSGWEDGNTGDPADNVVLPFGAGFVCRNGTASPLSLSFVGTVPMSSHRQRLYTLTNGTSQDIYFGYNSPVPEAVINLGIPAIAGDQIIGFDNSAPGINKGATIIYGYTGSGWEDGNTGDPLDVNVKLQPGFGYIYRRISTGAPSSVAWKDLQTYLQ